MFKAYQQQMEKALRAFECTTEWADLVNALGKVNKVLLNYSQFSKIPCDAILGRRLAQCLHPGLPNGVQLKALETYDLLFKAIGSDNLMHELSKFSNGLFPLLSHADLNVKPSLLELYEVHFLPLNERLRPALDGFLIATLHGLEENTDFYQRTDDLLMKVCAGVGPEFFYASLWRCILIDPSVRLHGMNFLITHFNKKRPLESQLHILGNSPEALIEAICVSLLDIRNVLVQRAALDLLLCCFPLHNQQITPHEMIKLATGAVTVLLRRDTSLSRRLLAWIFNLEASSGKKPSNLAIYGSVSADSKKSREQREKERKTLYFNEYARPLLLQAFNNCLSDPSKIIDIPNCWSSLGDYWCYRLLICLIDHSELCELVIDDLCLDIMRALCMDFRREENQRPEFIRTIRLLLTSMNVSYLWNRVYNLLVEVCENSNKDKQEDAIMADRIGSYIQSIGSKTTNILELCATFDFMSECFPIENYVEIAKEFLPKILNNLLNLMIDHCDILKVDEYLSLIKVVENMFDGVSLLHRDKSLLNRDDTTRSSINQVPSPLRSNHISSVAEGEEYLAEEAIEPSNDSSNNPTDEAADKSYSEATSQSNHLDLDDNVINAPPLNVLIERFQQLFHTFVSKRLLKAPDMNHIYQEFAQLLDPRQLDRYNEPMGVDSLDYNTELVVVYEAFCKVSSFISGIPIMDEEVYGTISQSALSRNTNSESITSKTPVITGRESVNSEDTKILEKYDDTKSTMSKPSIQQSGETTDREEEHCGEVTEKLCYQTCRPYIKDLMLLSYRVGNIKINYASMKILLDMLSTSQLAYDSEFASANQFLSNVTPSFSDELNASVVGDTSMMFERRNSIGTLTKSSKRMLLSAEEFSFIARETSWFSLAMKVLWRYLSVDPMMRLETVHLIQNMHNLTYQSLVCEDIICASFNNGDEQIAYESRRRFILLFSLMKIDRSDQNLRQREFERPLFFMLDSLTNKMDPYNCIAKDWLSQVYKLRSTSRVLEPILKILLNPDTARTPVIFTKINISNIHHTHMHLYTQVYDSRRILYALNTLWNVLTTDPHQGLIRMANSSIRCCYELLSLHTRHTNALSGNGFDEQLSMDSRGQAPSFLELTITVCLNFLSGYYMPLPGAKLSEIEIQGNQKVRMLASEILRTIFGNLFDAIKGCPTNPIHDLLNRCKAQEIVLLHVATSVQLSQQYPSHDSLSLDQQLTSSEQLLLFNNNSDDFERTILKLLEELMILEYKVAPQNVISETENLSRSARTRDIPDISCNSLKYFYNILISSQRLFLSSVKAALQNIGRSELHVNWLSMIETTIPISGRSLTRWIGCVLSRLCDNLCIVSKSIIDCPEAMDISTTPNYLYTLMSSLSHLTHYCLLDKNPTPSLTLSQRSDTGSTTTLTSTGNSLGPVSHVMSIFHVFSNDQGHDSGIGSQSDNYNDPLLLARREVLNKMPLILSAIIQVWKATGRGREPSSWLIFGDPAEVRKQILSLLSPISLQHGVQFMNAVAFVWHELKSKSASRKDVIPRCTPDQSLLVEIVASISDLPMDMVLQTTRQVITDTEVRSPRRVPLEVGLLQFFLAYIRLFPGSQLIECWKPLLALLRDGLQLGRPAMPQAQFTLLALLHEFVQTAPLIEERKDQKELQEVAQKLIDSLTSVVSARLAQTRWLRRALEVEPGPQQESDEEDLATKSGSATVADPDEVNIYLARYSVQALNALAEYVAPVLDVVFASDEKEKVVGLINGIMYYINPYLKNYQRDNSPSFLACSHLLSSISGYQYTRKAWRKDALELLLDPQFFHMDTKSMKHWRVIVDHLMTHDKTTFRDFLARMSVNQSGGALKIFGSRDQESEQRAQLIKRMAFILFCSERDQYHKYTPEIQEKLIESLRDGPSETVQSEIMLCFRVLIMRSSAHLLTSLWPFVYTEMVQGLLDIESYLEQSITVATAANLDQRSNMQVTSNTEARFHLFLYTCKLLDTVLALPADSLPQFQMYRWSFIGADVDFEPHLVRIERRLREVCASSVLLPYRSHYPVLTLNRIDNLLDLHPFFNTLVKLNRGEYDPAIEQQNQQQQQQQQAKNLSPCNYDDPIEFIDAILENDFLDD